MSMILFFFHHKMISDQGFQTQTELKMMIQQSCCGVVIFCGSGSGSGPEKELLRNLVQILFKQFFPLGKPKNKPVFLGGGGGPGLASKNLKNPVF